MSRLLVPTVGPTDWRRLLAEPVRHWRQGRSAYELAVAWEAAQRTERGLPLSIAKLFDEVPALAGALLLVGLPEHQVHLEGGGHASQTDLWALLRVAAGLVSAAVEGKAGEGFDKLVPEWLSDASPRSGKPRRLSQLCQLLQLSEAQAHRCRYQLLHRSAAAILEAQRFGAQHAVLLVHSFTPDPDGIAAYTCFGEQLGVDVAENGVFSAGQRAGVELWLAWATSEPADDRLVRAALM